MIDQQCRYSGIDPTAVLTQCSLDTDVVLLYIQHNCIRMCHSRVFIYIYILIHSLVCIGFLDNLYDILSMTKAMSAYNHSSHSTSNALWEVNTNDASTTVSASVQLNLKRPNSSRGISTQGSRLKRSKSANSNHSTESAVDNPPEISLDDAQMGIVQEQLQRLRRDEDCLDSIISTLNDCCDADIWNNRYV